MSLFFKRRTVYLPTLLGSVIIVLIISSVSVYFFSQLALFLAYDKKTESEYLIVEGWLNERALLKALELFQESKYKALITTGSPDYSKLKQQDYNSYADKAGQFLRRQGLAKEQLIVVPAPASAQNRTFLSAVSLRKWFKANQISPQSLQIVSEGVHSRRTLLLYSKAFNDEVTLGITSTEPSGFSLAKWWQTSEGAKTVLTELIAWLFVNCCFDPGDKNSHQEEWGSNTSP